MIDRWMDDPGAWVDRRTGPIDGWMDLWTDRRTGPADGWEGGRKNARKYVWTDR